MGLGLVAFEIVNGHAAVDDLDANLHRMRESGAALQMIVSQHAEVDALLENGGFIIEGAVAKMERGARGNGVALDGLQRLAGSERLSVFVEKQEKDVAGALLEARRNGIGLAG